MLITRSNNQELGIRKRTLGREVKIGPLSLQFITVIILATLALLYLAQSTQSASKNYKINTLENKKQQLKEENERLEVESIRLKSLNEVKIKSEEMKMEDANKINYLPVEQSLTRR